MFGRKKKLVQVLEPAPLISATVLAQVQDALEPFGLSRFNDYGFSAHINDPASYWGGAVSLEWTISEAGARFIVEAFNGKVSSITVMNHPGNRFSPEQLNEVNAHLDAILSA